MQPWQQNRDQSRQRSSGKRRRKTVAENLAEPWVREPEMSGRAAETEPHTRITRGEQKPAARLAAKETEHRRAAEMKNQARRNQIQRTLSPTPKQKS
jgi:hypothetical protein